MSCRICLSDEHPETFVSPCRCVGTSSYIHEECLTTYFSYYPDRICRVCLTEMDGPAPDSLLSYMMFVLLGMTITYSSVDPLIKIGLALGLMGMIVYYAKHKLFNDTVVAFLIALYLTFATGGHPDAIFIFLLSLYLGGLIATIFATRQLGLFLMIAPPMFAIAAHVVLKLDAFATSVYVSLLFLLWYAWIRTAVRNYTNALPM